VWNAHKTELGSKRLAICATVYVGVPCQDQRQTIYSDCPNFHPNHFTSGGAIAERVNTVRTRHKHHASFVSDFGIGAHSSAPELSPVLKTSTSRSTAGRDILSSCISTYRSSNIYKLVSVSCHQRKDRQMCGSPRSQIQLLLFCRCRMCHQQ